MDIGKKSVVLSVVLPSYNEQENIGKLIKKIKKNIKELGINYEIIVIDGGSKDNTVAEAEKEGAKVFQQKSKGYGGAILEGFNLAVGGYILTMDADLSHDPIFMKDIWKKRNDADLIIASRYVKGGKADMAISRIILSKLLNTFFAMILSLPIKDLSSGFRMYKKEIAKESLTLKGTDFNILQEIAIQAYNNGWRIKEMPFYYESRKYGKSKVKLLKFAISYFKTLRRMWEIRNSILAADYDDRAYNSIIPLQRYWQRRRYKIIMDYTNEAIKNKKEPKIIDIGCGSTKVIQSIKDGVGLDILFKKLRFLKKTNKYLVNASVMDLPLKEEKFDYVICSELIEHIPPTKKHFEEIRRITKKGGTLIIGTPDYNRLSWRIVEWLYRKVLPNAYADKHISHYTAKSLERILQEFGFEVVNKKYVFGSEVIMKTIRK